MSQKATKRILAVLMLTMVFALNLSVSKQPNLISTNSFRSPIEQNY